MILFVGPIGDLGGPAIKNKILLKYLNTNKDIKICNTHDRKLATFIKSVLVLVFAKEKQIIVAVSRNGRLVLYPILRLKKALNKSLKYSTICIGGTIVEDALKHPVLIGKALESADVVTVETQMLKEKVVDKLKLTNVFYLPNYKEIINKHEVYDSSNHRKYQDDLKFVFLSSIRNVKGIRTMLEAFMKILNSYPKATLDIFGPIREDFDIKLFEEIKPIRNIQYKGVVDNDKVIETLKNYDVFLFPTEYSGEGFPAVLIEAYLSGLVVIASDINYNTEIVGNGINGWIFPAGNIEELVKAITKCFENSNKLIEISKTNINRSYDFDARKVIDLYSKHLKKAGW